MKYANAFMVINHFLLNEPACMPDKCSCWSFGWPHPWQAATSHQMQFSSTLLLMRPTCGNNNSHPMLQGEVKDFAYQIGKRKFHIQTLWISATPFQFLLYHIELQCKRQLWKAASLPRIVNLAMLEIKAVILLRVHHFQWRLTLSWYLQKILAFLGVFNAFSTVASVRDGCTKSKRTFQVIKTSCIGCGAGWRPMLLFSFTNDASFAEIWAFFLHKYN